MMMLLLCLLLCLLLGLLRHLHLLLLLQPLQRRGPVLHAVPAVLNGIVGAAWQSSANLAPLVPELLLC